MEITAILMYISIFLVGIFLALVVLRKRRNIFLIAGTMLAAISFAMFMLFIIFAGPESFGMLWMLFASPVIFIISLILLIIGMVKRDMRNKT
ncbi:MAG: hypothetical protein KKD46_03465 [Euryarchaeota archaeon]|nr:hypothetical protein [Euryarchaeota archaeon]MBU4339959.1 hypothetical protein [Euryarchaeota archaeon]MCG2738125.1 hypothetical protein [Candidatus Methanoperedenaceae archaeon]